MKPESREDRPDPLSTEDRTELRPPSPVKLDMTEVSMELRPPSPKPLNMEEIREVIGLRSGKRPSESKDLDDIHEIAENRPFGTEIEIPERGETKGFRCIRTFITSDQARLLINMVQTCKFITPEQRDDLCRSLHDMVSYHQQDKIVESVYVDERELPAHSEQDVFKVADVAFQAIKAGKRIAFQYAQRGADGKEYLIWDAAEFEEDPIGLVFSYGNYYLETWVGESQRRYARRLSKMRNARVSDVDINDVEKVERLRRATSERIGQQFDMWGDDQPRTLFFHAEKRGIGCVYDRFGPSVKFHNVDQNKSSGYFCADVQLGPTFYRWLFGIGGLVTLVEPVSPLWVSQFSENEAVHKKTFDVLKEDYRKAGDSLWRQVEQFLSAHGKTVLS